MVRMRCIVPNCINNINNESKSSNNQPKTAGGVSFHMIPTDKFVRPHWLNALQITEDDANRFDKNKDRVCSSHFTETCFFTTSNNRKLLIVGSVPTLNLNSILKNHHNDHIYCAETVDSPIIQSDDEDFIMEELPVDSFDVEDFETENTLKIEKLDDDLLQSNLLIEKFEPEFESNILIENCEELDLKSSPKSQCSDFEISEDYDYDFLKEPRKSLQIEMEIIPSPEFNKSIIQNNEKKMLQNKLIENEKQTKSKSGVIYLDKTNPNQNYSTTKSVMSCTEQNLPKHSERQNRDINNLATNMDKQNKSSRIERSLQEQKVNSTMKKVKKKINKKKNQKRFECDFCGVKYTRNLNLKEHLFSHTGGEKRFKCNICIKSFNRRSQLKSHLLQHSELDKKYSKCFFCAKEFNCEASKRKHEKKEHAGSDSLVCIFCEQPFKNKAALANHEFTHTGLNIYDKCKAYLMKKYQEGIKQI